MARAWLTSLGGFFFECHAAHQVGGALFRWELGIHEGQIGGILRPSEDCHTTHESQAQNPRRNS